MVVQVKDNGDGLKVESKSSRLIWEILKRENRRDLVLDLEWDKESQNLVPGFPGGAAVENLPANAGDTGSRPGLGRSHMPRSN